MEKVTIEEVYKRNVMEIVKDHKKNCKGEECGISLFILIDMSEKAGVKFTDTEKMELL